MQYWPGNWVIRFSHPSLIAWSRPGSRPSDQGVIWGDLPGVRHSSEHKASESMIMSALNTCLENYTLTVQLCLNYKILKEIIDTKNFFSSIFCCTPQYSWSTPDIQQEPQSWSWSGLVCLGLGSTWTHITRVTETLRVQLPQPGRASRARNSDSDVNENSFHARWINLGRWTTTIEHRLCPGLEKNMEIENNNMRTRVQKALWIQTPFPSYPHNNHKNQFQSPESM